MNTMIRLLFISLLSLFAYKAHASCIYQVNHGFDSHTNILASGEQIPYASRPFFEVRNIGAQDIRVELETYITRQPLETETLGSSGGLYIVPARLLRVQCLSSNSGAGNLIEEAFDHAAGHAEAEGRILEDFISSIEKTIATVFDQPQCSDADLGNEDAQSLATSSNALINAGARGNKNKFLNFEHTSEFSIMNNYLLMQASNKTYRDQLKYGPGSNGRWRPTQNNDELKCALKELYRYWGMKEAILLNEFYTGANAVLSFDDKKVIIAVRGTELAFAESIIDTITDVQTNMASIPMPAREKGFGPTGEIHTGYAYAALALFVQVEALLDIFNLEKHEIYVTGHSLGGATATLLASKLEQQKYKVKAAYVYAPPKVGDLAFYQELKSRLNLFVTLNYRDPVPTLVRTDIREFDATGMAPMFFTGYLAPTAEGAKTVVYFKEDHSAVYMTNETHSRQARNLVIREDQGGPYPQILMSQGLLSDEWHFHDGNFYVAFTYNEILKAGLAKPNAADTQPEFHKHEMCLLWDKTEAKFTVDWNASYGRFLRDKNTYPFQRCVW